MKGALDCSLCSCVWTLGIIILRFIQNPPVRLNYSRSLMRVLPIIQIEIIIRHYSSDFS